MRIKLPTMVGIASHARLDDKIAKAVIKKEFPVELDCSGTTFTTGGFTRFLVKASKSVKKAGGYIRLTGVTDSLYDGIKTLSLDSVVEVERKGNK